MSAVVGALRAVLSLESAAFTSGLKQAQSGLAGFASSAKKMGSTLQKIGAVMSIAGVGMAAGIRSQLNLADDMSKAAQKFGVPIEQLSALKYAADLSGVSLDTLGTGLRKLSQNMDSASRGNKVATDLFKRIGVDVRDATGALRPAADVMADISAVMAAMPDGVEKTALAMELFGKSGTEMIPLLNAGKDGLRGMMDEAAQLGIVISEKTGKAAEEFNDNISRLGAATQGIFAQLAAELAPTLVKISDAIVELAKGFGQLSPEMRSFLAHAAAALVIGGPMVIGLGLAVSAVGSLAAAFGLLAGAIAANPVIAVITTIAVSAGLIYYYWGGIAEFFTGIWASVKASAEVAWGAIKDTIAGAIQYVIDKWNEFTGLLTAALQTARDIGTAIANAIGLGDEYDAKLKARGIATSMDGVKIGSEYSDTGYTGGYKVGGDVADGLADGIGAGMEANRAEIQSYLGGATDAARDEFDTHSPSRVFRRIGQFLTEGLALGIGDNKPMVEAAVAEVGSAAKDGVAQAAESMRSAGKGLFSDWVTGAKSARDALSALAAKLADMLADSAFDMLFGKGGSVGGLFDGLASLFGFAKGGVFSGGNVTAFASGGVVGGPTLFGMNGGLGLMGEAGAEAIMPLTRGPGGRLGVQAMGGGQAVRIVVEENPMFAARVQAISQGSAVEVVRQYDAEIAPVSRGRAAREVG